jgi:Domain of unknown function (DUF1905)
MKFEAPVVPAGTATGVEIPRDVVEAMRAGARPPITVMINGHTWRSRITVMCGKSLVGISAANRAASGIVQGDIVVVDLRQGPPAEYPPVEQGPGGDSEARPRGRPTYQTLIASLLHKYASGRLKEV